MHCERFVGSVRRGSVRLRSFLAAAPLRAGEEGLVLFGEATGTMSSSSSSSSSLSLFWRASEFARRR